MKALLTIGIASAFLFSGCSSGRNYTPEAPMAAAPSMQTHSISASSDASVLQTLNHEFTIGSTVDPINGGSNPYGLDVAKSSAGKIGAGDLVVCNFNDITGVEGTGESIIGIRPVVGSGPRSIAANKALMGCTALALSPNDIIWDTSFAKNTVPVFEPNGALIRNSYFTFNHPFGITFAKHATSLGVVAF